MSKSTPGSRSPSPRFLVRNAADTTDSKYLASRLSSEPKSSPRIFASNIPANVNQVSAQLSSGIFWIRRTATLLRKTAELEAQYAKDLKKLLQNEVDKAEDIGRGKGGDISTNTSGPFFVQGLSLELEFEGQSCPLRPMKDHMSRTWNCTVMLHQAIREQINFHMKQSGKIQQIILPLKVFSDSAESRLKAICFRAEVSVKAFFQAKEKMIKRQEKFISAWEKSQKGGRFGSFFSGAGATLGRAGGLKNISLLAQAKVSSAPTTAEDDKLEQLASDFYKCLNNAKALKKKMLEVDLPAAQNELEELERERMLIVQMLVTEFMEGAQSFNSGIAESAERLKQQLELHNIDADLYNFVALIQKGSSPKKDLEEDIDTAYQIPYVCQEKQEEEKQKMNYKKKVPLFGTSLDEIMEAEIEMNSLAEMPFVVGFLMDSIRKAKGFETEGIFRLSSGKQDMDVYRSKLEEGDYTVQPSDPHIPANTLKEWLRSLPEPLIPFHMYQKCIQMAKEGDNIPSEQYCKILRRVKRHPRNVLIRVLLLIHEISQPEIVKRTKMPLKNLAIVFAPSILRSPTGDPMVMFKNNVTELQFVCNLVEKCSDKFASATLKAVRKRTSKFQRKILESTTFQSPEENASHSPVSADKEDDSTVEMTKPIAAIKILSNPPEKVLPGEPNQVAHDGQNTTAQVPKDFETENDVNPNENAVSNQDVSDFQTEDGADVSSSLKGEQFETEQIISEEELMGKNDGIEQVEESLNTDLVDSFTEEPCRSLDVSTRNSSDHEL